MLSQAISDGLSQALPPLIGFALICFALKFLQIKLDKFIDSKFKKKNNVLRLVKTSSAPTMRNDFSVNTAKEYFFDRRNIMTETEKAFFFDLLKAVPELYIFPQVSFLALLNPKGQASLGKVQSKRADFVVYNADTEQYCIIELDDKTHIGKQSTDLERDMLFASVGIRSLRYKTNNKPSTEALREDIFANLTSK